MAEGSAAIPPEATLLRSGGRGWLSLALIEARNHTLRLMSAWEGMLEGLPAPEAIDPAVVAPLWRCGRIAWFQEAWVGRNVQRLRGAAADPAAPRLASIEPRADEWFAREPAGTARWHWTATDGPNLRQYLLATLESTLELLESSADRPEALHAFRLALVHEALCGERLVETAQTMGLGHAVLRALQDENPRPVAREALGFPATRWRLGTPADAGFRLDNEAEPEAIAVPEFEIDAQPVSWAAYGEFVEDGGYDDPAWWSEAGRDWLGLTGRRSPRHVERMRSGVLIRRFGQAMRAPAGAPVVHLSLHEAEAWCRWAGRRLPTEVEWELAAHRGPGRGWRWGEVREWTATRFRPYPGFVPGPWRERSSEAFGRHQAVRGASFATAALLRHPKFRDFAAPDDDSGFIGFRSCAV